MTMMMEFDMKFITKDNLNEYSNQIEANKKDVVALNKRQFAASLLDFKDNFTDFCNETIDEKLENYDKVAKDFQQFFNQREICELFDRKADLELIRRIQTQKANKEDVLYLNQMVTEMDAKIVQLSVMQKEIANSLIPEVKTERETLKTKQQLIKNSNIVSKWIKN